jgi:hypothetical protein
MPVVVDNKPLSIDQLGLKTFGQVLTHLQRENRLIVHVLIDGQEPDLDSMSSLRQTSTDHHTIYVETTEPAEMANEVLNEVNQQIEQSEHLRAEAVDCLLAGNHNKAFEKLSGCFGRWQHTQESIEKIAQLLRIDLGRVRVDDATTLTEFLKTFGEHLKTIRQSLEDRDFVTLADVLQYELPDSTSKWKSAVEAVRSVVK